MRLYEDVFILIISIIVFAHFLYQFFALQPHLPSELFHERKNGFTIYYNITYDQYAKYINETGREPPTRPVLVIREDADDDEIVYADKNFTPVKEYLEQLDRFRESVWKILLEGFLAFLLALLAVVISSSDKKEGEEAGKRGVGYGVSF